MAENLTLPGDNMVVGGDWNWVTKSRDRSNEIGKKR